MKSQHPRMRKVRDCETIEFFPHDTPFPKVSIKDHLQKAATDIVTILSQPPSPTKTSLEEKDSTRNAILNLEYMLNRI